MPIRIYAFAKEIGVENKVLLDLCAKAGINGKGSALASLSDEEVAKIRGHLQSSGDSAASEKPAAKSGNSQEARPLERQRGLDRFRSEKPKSLDRPRTDRRSNQAGSVESGSAPAASGSVATPTLPPSDSDVTPVSRTETPETPPIQAPSPGPGSSESTPVQKSAKPVENRESSGSRTTGPLSGRPGGRAPADSRQGSPREGQSRQGGKSPLDRSPGRSDRPGRGEDQRRDRDQRPGDRQPAARQQDQGRSGQSRPNQDRTQTRPVRPGSSPLGSRLGMDPMRRKAPLGGRQGPMRNLDSRRGGNENRDDGKNREPRKKSGPRLPTVNFAAMPEVKQPKQTVKKPTEKVIKPDMALPTEAIRQVKQQGTKGGTSPLKQFTDNMSQTKKSRFGPGKEETPGKEDPRKKGRKGKGGTGGTEEGLGSTRQKRRPMGSGRRNNRFDSYSGGGGRRRHRRSGQVKNTAAPRKDNPVLQLPCTVRSFSEVAGVSTGQVLKALMVDFGLGMTVNINSVLDSETVELLVDHLDCKVEVRQEESLEDSVINELEKEDDPSDLVSRPPIVTFLGHVDHGKTSLLDAIIGLDVVSGEAGGITQHIRAYSVDKDGKSVAFVDTPGHEAFTEMRARGANVTDVAVLVVAADDGIMPQTEEAISHAKAAGVPIIVAMNKIDLPGANPDKVLQDLASHELMPSQWGGDVEVIQTSAIQGTGMDDLLETILTTAELYEYKANPNRSATGTCLESQQDSDKGVVAKLMVQKGTLKVGDVILCGNTYGRVKAMNDTLKPKIKHDEAGPSVPVNVTGFESAPNAGDQFFVVDDIAKAREIAESREFTSRDQSLSGITKRVSLEDFQKRLEAGDLAGSEHDVVTLNLIIRADVRGSIEAIQKELGKLDHPEVKIKILQALVGGISVGDVRLAQASDAVIVGFNVVPDEAARNLAEEIQVEIRRYDIIYKVADDIKATLEGKLKPEEQNVEQGAVMVLRTFNISKVGTIAGCRVIRGSIHRDSRVRIIRDSRIIGDYPIHTLKREKDLAKEVNKGMECGIRLDGFNDVKEGDLFEAYKIEEVARTL